MVGGGGEGGGDGKPQHKHAGEGSTRSLGKHHGVQGVEIHHNPRIIEEKRARNGKQGEGR